MIIVWSMCEFNRLKTPIDLCGLRVGGCHSNEQWRALVSSPKRACLA